MSLSLPELARRGLARLAAAAGTALVLAAGGVPGIAPLASPAAAQDHDRPSYVRLAMHRSQVVRIPRPADTVVVGDPDIADVVLQDATTLVLTGKNLGETNLIILDEAGDPIVDETIVVAPPLNTTVSVFTPEGRSDFRCSPDCSEIAADAGARRR